VVMTDAESDLEDEEGLRESEPEIDIQTDPFQTQCEAGQQTGWEDEIRSIQTREPKPPGSEEQRIRIREIIALLNSETSEPTEQQVREALEWIRCMQSINPNHEKFVAANFQHYYPAWHELLKGVKRKSARSVLSWIKKGFKPRFKGTKDAKKSKREIVVGMLRKVVPADRIPEMLSGQRPHQVKVANHQSLYKKWDFTVDQVGKLMEYGAAGIWTEKEKPVVINPMGVVDSA
jgi:hypothetical protein